MSRWLTAALAATCLVADAPAATAQPSLHWRELAVQARLEADGTLAVREDHAMVFTGEWNGGERSFWVRLGQQLTIDRVSRRDAATGEWVVLERGSLEAVDHWDMKNEKLRWRNRRPSDPAFDGTEIDTRLEYRLTGILRRDGNDWLLDHDFAFSDRPGEISHFVFALDLAPEWQAVGQIESRVDEGPLPTSAGRVVTARLRYVGAGVPAKAAVARLRATVVWSIVGAAGLAMLWLFQWAVGRERALGRMAPLAAVEQVDRRWLEEHLFVLAPEEAGAAWDDSVGSAEVAAMLARMQLEGKLASRVEEEGLLRRPNLHLKLLVERRLLSGAEHQLVGELFPSGNETDTASLRKHYARTGFDPAKRLEASVRDKLRERGGFSAPRLHPARVPSVVLIVLGVAGLVVAMATAPAAIVAPLALGFAALALWVPAFVSAFWLRPLIVGWVAPLVVIGVSEIAALAAAAFLGGVPGQSLLGLLGGATLLAGLARTVATALQSRHGEETIARRRELATARAWFEAELRRPAPRLEDAWAPYLIAFGLAPRMDRWWKSFGGATAAGTSSSWSGSGGGTVGGGSVSSGGWTGGGGSFGGAGATASWAIAATSMSAGVAAASSGSSGGGGGGGGGGSSGGGGGGGW